MYGRRAGRRHGGRATFPDGEPPPLNHAMLTGTVLGEPRQGRAPCGDPVVLLEVEFPVAHPDHPGLLWCHATCDVELPGEVGAEREGDLRPGAHVLVTGQLSERLDKVDGRVGRHPVIVARQIHPGALGGPSGSEGRS